MSLECIPAEFVVVNYCWLTISWLTHSWLEGRANNAMVVVSIPPVDRFVFFAIHSCLYGYVITRISGHLIGLKIIKRWTFSVPIVPRHKIHFSLGQVTSGYVYWPSLAFPLEISTLGRMTGTHLHERDSNARKERLECILNGPDGWIEFNNVCAIRASYPRPTFTLFRRSSEI